jgi:dipeptidyl aminopeptidase/acylaminoacyl peptidase
MRREPRGSAPGIGADPDRRHGCRADRRRRTIVAHEPCPTFADQASFDAAVKAYFEEDIVKAGLQRELATRPLTSIFTPADREALAVAAASGRCERITYLSQGLRVRGFIVRPHGSGAHPTLIFLRGGGQEYGKIEAVTLLTLLAFADAGFTVVATQYRGVDGGEGKDEYGGAEVADVLSLVPVAAAEGADTQRLFVVGGSRGGMEAVLALRRGLRAKAIALRAPLTDLWASVAARPELAEVYRATMPDYDVRKKEHFDERSAIRHVAEIDAPVLLLSARQDWRVHVDSVKAFDDALAAAGKPHKLIIYERDEHQLAFHRHQWIGDVVDWFVKQGAFESQ